MILLSLHRRKFTILSFSVPRTYKSACRVSGYQTIKNVKKIMARYRSPQRTFYRDEFKDKDGCWTAYMTNVMVSAYNTKQVKKGDAPATLEHLLKPRWKSGLVMDSESYVWFGAILQSIGEEAGLRFMRRLNEQDLTHVRGRRLMSQLVAAGEFDMTVEANLNSVLTLASQGAPLWFAPAQPLFYSPSMVSLAQGAPHPHAGALFIDYLLSKGSGSSSRRIGWPLTMGSSRKKRKLSRAWTSECPILWTSADATTT